MTLFLQLDHAQFPAHHGLVELSQLRIGGPQFRRGAGASKATDRFVFDLAYRPPLDWGVLLHFLDRRLFAGVEAARDYADAVKAMCAAMGSPHDVSGAAHLPDHVASYFGGLPKTEAATVLRLEGVAPSVKHRASSRAAVQATTVNDQE